MKSECALASPSNWPNCLPACAAKAIPERQKVENPGLVGTALVPVTLGLRPSEACRLKTLNVKQVEGDLVSDG